MSTVKNGRTILVGEDDLEVRSYLETALKCYGYTVEVAQDGEEVLAYLQSDAAPVSAVLLDIIMPRRDGLEALREIRRFHKDLPVVMISGASSPLNVVEAMKNGANDFLAKPVKSEDLRKVLKKVIEATAPPVLNQPDPAGAPAHKQVMFGTTPAMRELEGLIGQMGWSEAPVLIQGETGAGKEVIARELHARSPRAKKPFVKVNCVALPSELVESELFGYERGAFTGAFQRKPGMFELADGGTILLDEIGDMDFKLQAKILQVLQDQEFHRLGGKETVRVDVRVIAATHRDLEKAIVDHTFREDLYYRLNVIGIRVPALRERKQDLMAMADVLIKKHTPVGAPLLQVPPALGEVFLNYHWPGNIRELDNVVRKFLIFRDTELIARDLCARMEHKPERMPVHSTALAVTAAQNREPEPPQAAKPITALSTAGILDDLRRAKHDAERSVILAALKAKNWNRKQAAHMLKIDYKALLYKMKKLSIQKDKMALMQDGPDAEEALQVSAASLASVRAHVC